MGFFEFLFGGGGDSEPTVTTVPAPNIQVPGLESANAAATARMNATRPWMHGPYRASDYLHSFAATPNMLPQMHQMMGTGGGMPMAGGMGGGMGGGGGMPMLNMGTGFGQMGPQMGQFGMLFPQQMQQPGPGLMGNFGNPMQQMQQPQYSPLAWAMQLGQLFNQLGGMYNQQMGMPQMGQQLQQPQQQQQKSGGQNNAPSQK